MPTSPRDLMGGNASYKRTALLSNPRADVGIGPYAVGKFFSFNRGGFKVSGFSPSSVPGFARSTLSQERVLSPHPSRLRRATFPGGEGFLPAGVFYTRFVYPIRAWSTSLAQARPSVMAQTTRDWPRRQSPAAKILGFSVR